MSYTVSKCLSMSTVTIQMISNKGMVDKTESISEEVKGFLEYIENKMSFYLKNSDVSKINDNSGREYVKVSKDTMNVITKSIKYSILTEGAFDITLGPVIKEWGIFSEKEHVPDKNLVKKLLKLIGMDKILINDGENSVKLKELGQKIDLGGIAKGYATDKAVEIYKKNNIKSAMINIGGNVSVLGNKEDGTPWIVGIQDPYNDRGNLIGAVKCSDISVVTSGNYVRYFEKNNKEYGHIINPKTGIPVENNIISVTVICKSAIKADALSTSLFVMGKKKALDFILKENDFDCILITNDKEIWVTKDVSSNFYLVKDLGYKIKVL